MMKSTIGLLSFAALVAVAASQFGLPLGNVAKPLTNAAGQVAGAAGGLLGKQFGDFQKTFNKVYPTPEEKDKRLGIFSENQKGIFDLGKGAGFFTKMNEFGDLLTGEFNKLLNGLTIDRSKSHGEKFVHEKEGELPENFDWRDKGAVTPVRSQGQCASCYAFAASAALESHLFIKNGKLETLSPQNLMDCTQVKPYENYGCTSGAVDPTFDYIKDNGINADTIYPYQQKTEGQCGYKKESTIGTVKSYVLLDEGDEKGLEEAVATKGPVCAGIDASAQSFQFYGGGLYYEPTCGSTTDKINHAVLVVGYGVDNGQKYWTIKNSYGPDWGEKGYARIARNVTNPCAIASYALYPVV